MHIFSWSFFVVSIWNTNINHQNGMGSYYDSSIGYEIKFLPFYFSGRVVMEEGSMSSDEAPPILVPVKI